MNFWKNGKRERQGKEQDFQVHLPSGGKDAAIINELKLMFVSSMRCEIKIVSHGMQTVLGK